MPSSLFQFFLTPQETAGLVDRLLARHDVVVLREGWNSQPLLRLNAGEYLNYEAGHKDRPERLFVAKAPIGRIEFIDGHPFDLGMVMLDLPGRDEDEMLMGILSYKTSREKAQVAKELFDQIRRDLKLRADKKLLVRWPESTPATATSVRASRGIAKLVGAGATLSQRGVRGQDFVVSEDEGPK